MRTRSGTNGTDSKANRNSIGEILHASETEVKKDLFSVAKARSGAVRQLVKKAADEETIDAFLGLASLVFEGERNHSKEAKKTPSFSKKPSGPGKTQKSPVRNSDSQPRKVPKLMSAPTPPQDLPTTLPVPSAPCIFPFPQLYLYPQVLPFPYFPLSLTQMMAQAAHIEMMQHYYQQQGGSRSEACVVQTSQLS